MHWPVCEVCVEQVQNKPLEMNFPMEMLYFNREEKTLPLALSSASMQIAVDQSLEEITEASYNKNILNVATNFK